MCSLSLSLSSPQNVRFYILFFSFMSTLTHFIITCGGSFSLCFSCAHTSQHNTAIYFSSQLNFETTTKRLIIERTDAQCHLHCQKRLRLQAKCVCYCGRILHYKNDTIFKRYFQHLFRFYFSFFMLFYINLTKRILPIMLTIMTHIQVLRLILSIKVMGKNN